MLKHCGSVAVIAVMAVASASAQPPQFEVASVKASPPFDPQKILSGQQRIGMRMDASRVEIDGMPLPDIINTAFRTKSYQVTAPGWVGTGLNAPRFDIHATLPAGANPDQLPEMLQALLAERFKLTFHRETKEQPIFALIVGKNGPKLVESPNSPPAGDAAPAGAVPPPGPTSGLLGRGGTPAVQISGNPQTGMTIKGAATGTMRMSMSPEGTMHLEADKVSMASLAETLTRFLDRPVVDQTGLKGNYKIALDLAREDLMNAVRAVGVVPPAALGTAPGATGGAPAASDPSGGSIFRSVEQLGLKLDSRKTPIDHLVIDHLERTPTED
jgi:uncharacterized protein (TIGR03435 family)